MGKLMLALKKIMLAIGRLMHKLFALRGELTRKQRFTLITIGWIVIVGTWWLITIFTDVKPSTLPSPGLVGTAGPEMVTNWQLIPSAVKSIFTNLLGYVEAITISIVFGFLIGLFPFFRGMFERHITALRYLPLTALLGVLTKWFGIGMLMKVQFLTLGIVVYMIPAIIQRIDEVKQVYIDTAKTHGANKWQMIRTVFIPDVLSRFADDIRVLTPISWTYIIIAEMTNSSNGGLGALVFQAQKSNRYDIVYAIVVLILLFGIMQDKFLVSADRRIIKHKYV